MEIYSGEYITAQGEKIPYIIEIGWNHIYIIYDRGEGRREQEVKAITDEFGDFTWKLNKASIKFQSPAQLLRTFTSMDAIARATFRHFTGIN